ncbi:MBL fold metallo-hydrolase [Arthrobacter sp. RIT-PI-e]|uniref:MBL fold metallo-hydrolase n=1 Tax=Arthrobacter sp. RIT-PI-e TaxID=1681197 RepID=UPI0009E1DD38|nr:MBL fold metallo-hydrolase [Arthrobacter sp. RIT-PI-e]
MGGPAGPAGGGRGPGGPPPRGARLAGDHELPDGEVLAVPGSVIRVLATPGHTGGHICLVDERRKLLFTGDHVLPAVFPGLGLGGPTVTNPLADYAESVRRVCRYPEHEVLPGHGHRFTGVADRARECLEHQLQRTRQVAAALEEARTRSTVPTVWELAAGLTWSAGWAGLQGFQLLSALSQTAMHRDHVGEPGAPAP